MLNWNVWIWKTLTQNILLEFFHPNAIVIDEDKMTMITS